ncbi:MAG: glutamate racemase, partial [Lachnospiraceae bacterium]
GIEPALKPAVKAKEHSKVVVMATPMTLSQTKFNSMIHIYEDDANIIKMPCPGLVEYIESGVLDGPVLDAYLEKQFAPYDKAEIDAVVLGCTHYPLIREVIQKHLPGVFVYDGGFGTAKQTKRRLEERGLLSDRESGGKVEDLQQQEHGGDSGAVRRLLNM